MMRLLLGAMPMVVLVLTACSLEEGSQAQDSGEKQETEAPRKRSQLLRRPKNSGRQRGYWRGSRNGQSEGGPPLLNVPRIEPV